MRIALVITELDPGGAELCLTELALYLANKRHAVEVWSIGPPPGQGREGLVQRLDAAGIKVHFGNARGTLDSWRVVRWLRGELRKFQPVVVQSMLWHANIMTAAALWTSTTTWIGGMRVSEPRRGRWWLERLASRRMQRLVCVSQDVYEHALRKERIAQEKLVVIPNGVSERLLSDSLAPRDLSQWIDRASGHVLLFVGRLEPQKGVLAMLDHVPRVLDGHRDWSIILLGQGSQQSAVETKLQTLGLESKVRLAGWQSDAPNWMAAADVLLLPAEYEGMPNVLLEAMAVGKPFVAFAVDGVKQLTNTGDGYPAKLAAAQLASPGDWPEFVHLVREQMAREELRRACGQVNRQHAAEYFQLKSQLRKYEELYCGL